VNKQLIELLACDHAEIEKMMSENLEKAFAAITLDCQVAFENLCRAIEIKKRLTAENSDQSSF
jgi:hypothetical protein